MSSVKSFVSLQEKYDRIVVLIDMDCFYCQVEEYLDPERLSGRPIAVVQYLENAGIIAVNYAARALGVTRHMREKEAKAACSELICVKVPSKNGKADISKYRDAGIAVAKVLQSFTPLLERASIDEAYLDITDNVCKRMQQMKDGTVQLTAANFANTFAVGYEKIGNFVQDVTSSVDKDYEDVPDEDRKSVASSKLRLLVGAAIVNEIRKAVKDQTKYDCSAGIAHNKILAKLTAGMNKPNKQTILPIESIPQLFNDLAISKVKSMGGKLGEEVCAKLNAKTMADLMKFSEVELQHHFQARIGSWLYWMARGIELEKVTPKFMSKSIAVSKNFRGKNEISSSLTLKFWLKELAKEIVERLEKDAADCNRTSKQLIVGFTQGDAASTRTIPLNGNSVNNLTADQIADEAFEMIKKHSSKFLKEGTVIMSQNIKHLAITTGKFEDNNASGQASGSNSLQALLKNHKKVETKAANPPVVAESSTDSKSRCATLEMLKKFEMKSPKGMQRKSGGSNPLNQTIPPVESKIAPSPAKPKEIKKFHVPASFQLSVSEKFEGDFTINGVATFGHWTGVLADKLVKEIENHFKKSHRTPEVLILKFKQVNGTNIVEVSKNLQLSAFEDKIIDMDVIVEAVKRTEGFLNDDGKIRDPIVQIELIATEFESKKSWDFVVKHITPVESEFTCEVPAFEDEEVGNSDDNEEEICATDEEVVEEEPVEETADENAVDEDLGNYLRAELDDIDRQQSANTSKNEMEECDSPKYSPAYEPEDSNEATTENLPPPEKSPSPKKETIEQQPVAESSNQPGTSYLQTYAEFNPDPTLLELLNPKQECTECGKMIAKLDMISHLDHHLAFQIANQQRLEFRSQQKSSGSPVTPYQSVSKKAVKPKTKTSKAPAGNTLDKFAVRKSGASDTTPAETEGQIKCEECRNFIPAAEYVCHLDYHYAQKLRAENLVTTSKVEPNRKRPASAQKNQPKMKSMKSYFAAN